MNKALQIAHLTVLLAGAVLLSVLAYEIHSLSGHADSTLSGLDSNIGQLHATLETINAPCTGFHGSVSCGVLAQASQTEKNIGIMAGQGAEQTRLLGVLIASTTDNLDKVASSASDTLHTLSGTATAATETIQTAGGTIASAQPALEAITGAANATTAAVSDPNIKRLIAASADTTEQVDGTATTVNRVTAKIAAPYLNPPNRHWYQYIKPNFDSLWKAWLAVGASPIR